MAERSVDEITSLIAELGHHGLGGINPDAEQLHALLSSNRTGPLHFVNLLSYRDRAEYPDGHERAPQGLSGADAYALYGAVAFEQVTRRGGRLTLYNDVCQVLIGERESWHQIAIMEYAGTDAFLDMIVDPRYVAALVDRDAGLARTLVLVSRPLLPTAG